MTRSAGASNPRVRDRIRTSTQVVKSAPRTLSRWRHGFKFDLQRRRAARERFHDPGPAAPACGDGRPIRPEPLEPPMRERQDGAAGLRRERDVDLGLPRPVWIPPRERSSRGTRLPLVRVSHRPVAGHPPRMSRRPRSTRRTSKIGMGHARQQGGCGGAGPGRRAPRDPPGRGRIRPAPPGRRHRLSAPTSSCRYRPSRAGWRASRRAGRRPPGCHCRTTPSGPRCSRLTEAEVLARMIRTRSLV